MYNFFPREATVALILLLMGCAALDGQVLASWDFENITSAVPALPIPASQKDSRVRFASASIVGARNNGSPAVCSGNESWSTNFWPTGGLNFGSFLQFSIVLDPDYSGQVTNFAITLSASSGSSARTFQIFYSTNGFGRTFVNGGNMPAGSCSRYTRGVSASIQPGGSIAFQVHCYGQDPAAQAASVRVDNVTIFGQATFFPIVLTSFKGYADRDGVLLEWTTAAELHNDYMAVERSTDGQAFVELGRVAGAGTTTEEQTYSFRDAHPAVGTNYYRLRQVDFDGTATYHKIIAVDYEYEKPAEPLIFSTAQGRLRIVWDRPPATAWNWQLFDLSGRLRASGQLSDNELEPILPAGWYVLVLGNGQNQVSHPLIVSD